MREIKFRVWGKEEERYYYDCGIFLNEIMVNFDGDGYDIVDDIETQREYILEQYTGLKDINDEEIYEGDCLGHMKNIVEFSNGCFNINGDRQIYNGMELEIVGNIHQERE